MITTGWVDSIDPIDRMNGVGRSISVSRVGGAATPSAKRERKLPRSWVTFGAFPKIWPYQFTQNDAKSVCFIDRGCLFC